MKTLDLLAKYSKLVESIVKPGSPVFQIFRYGKWQSIGEITDIDKDGIGWEVGKYRVVCRGITIASWELYRLQHCCAVCVSTAAFVDPCFRNFGLGKLFNNLRQEVARMLGYSVLMCTDITTNLAQRKVLATNGWKDIHSVVNKRTGNTVILSVINL